MYSNSDKSSRMYKETLAKDSGNKYTTLTTFLPANAKNSSLLSAQAVTRFLFLVIVVFIPAHIVAVYLDYSGLPKTAFDKEFIKRFSLNSEAGVGTLFSVLILLAASLLLFFIYKSLCQDKLKKNRRYWATLSLLFLFLSLDEGFTIHEHLIPITRNITGSGAYGLLFWSWIIPYSFLVLITVAYFIRFTMRLPKAISHGFFLSGFIYVLGAIGIEMIEGYTVTHGFYLITDYFILLEEVLEMSGVVLFIRTLLRYIYVNKCELVFTA